MRKVSVFLLFMIFISCSSQGKRALIGETAYQQKLNANYKDASKSPLLKKDLKNFKGLDFFPIDSSFIVLAAFTKTRNAPTFKMTTTTDRKPLYKEYGTARFTLKGVVCELAIYQSQDDLRDEEYKDYLFLPFTDQTSGEGSYGGGRYMDLMLTDIHENKTITLDFNQTYNPYCAYNKKYSCPLTPRKNHLELFITAGIKEHNKID